MVQVNKTKEKQQQQQQHGRQKEHYEEHTAPNIQRWASNLLFTKEDKINALPTAPRTASQFFWAAAVCLTGFGVCLCVKQ